MKKDLKKLIQYLDDEDFRDNFKGKKLVDFISERFEVTENKTWKKKYIKKYENNQNN